MQHSDQATGELISENRVFASVSVSKRGKIAEADCFRSLRKML